MSGRDDERVGERLGDRYVVVTHVADGGMGSVYEARDELLARRVMVKVMHRHLLSDPTLMERFRREALAAASLGHPHIVQTTDFGLELGKQAFLVMEYLKGQTLGAALIAQGALSADRVVFIASQVLDALSSAHEAGIVHRDLKPSNIFLTQLSGVRDVVKLLDFGIAKLWESPEMQRLTRAGQVVGTPGFMAPEQLRGEEVDGRTDLYALGLVMYGGLSGRPPFPTHEGLDQAARVLAHEPRPLAELCPELDPGLVEVVSRAMNKDPASRFADADEMRRALGPWLDSSVRALHPTPPQPMAARPSGVPAPSGALPARRRPRRRISRGMIIAFVALVVLLAGGAALATVLALTYATGPEEPPPAVTPTTTPAAPPPTPTVGAPPTTAPLPSPPGAAPAPDQGEAPGADAPSPSSHRPGHGDRPSGVGLGSRQLADDITRGPCTPHLQVDTIAAFGLFAQADVGALVRAREPRLLACAARTPTGTHRVELESQVDAQGGTVAPRVTSPGDLGPTDLACVRQAFAGLELPETENEMAGVLRLGLTLKGCGQAGP